MRSRRVRLRTVMLLVIVLAFFLQHTRHRFYRSWREWNQFHREMTECRQTAALNRADEERTRLIGDREGEHRAHDAVQILEDAERYNRSRANRAWMTLFQNNVE
jgi:hypothetical protein